MNCPNLRNLSFPLDDPKDVDYPHIGRYDKYSDLGEPEFRSLLKLRVFRIVPNEDNMLFIAKILSAASSLQYLSLETDGETKGLLREQPNPSKTVLREKFDGAETDLKTLMARTVYDKISHCKNLHTLHIDSLPMHSSLAACLTSEALKDLTLRDVTEVEDLAEPLLNHKFSLRRLHLLIRYDDFTIFKSMLRNIHPGLEILIFCTIIENQIIVPPVAVKLDKDWNLRRRYLLGDQTISRHSETLKCLALLDSLLGTLVHTLDPVREPSFEHLRLEEFSTTCSMSIDVREHSLGEGSLRHVQFWVPDYFLETLRVLYLHPVSLPDDDIPALKYTMLEEGDTKIAQRVANELRYIYGKATSKPPLQYIIFDIYLDTMLTVEWVKTKHTSFVSHAWHPVVLLHRFARNYPFLHGQTFPLYDAAFGTGLGEAQLPAFRLT
ncbi:hypothetical protein ABW21_db0203116 [Orbilia brochopaga]|nr:hypothetical protein ABW21_db0203116 [Drechslerella brochopaga]